MYLPLQYGVKETAINLPLGIWLGILTLSASTFTEATYRPRIVTFCFSGAETRQALEALLR